MTDKECNRILAKAKAAQECIESIDAHDEWIYRITEKLEKLNVMEPFWVKVYGSIEGEGATDVGIPLNMREEVIEFIKEKLKKEIQGHKNSISEEYEKLNELLK